MSRTLQCTLNGIYTFASNWNHGGISCDVHFAGHLRSNRTNIWSDKSNIRNMQSGGARGLELRTAGLINQKKQMEHNMLHSTHYAEHWMVFSAHWPLRMADSRSLRASLVGMRGTWPFLGSVESPDGCVTRDGDGAWVGGPGGGGGGATGGPPITACEGEAV